MPNIHSHPCFLTPSQIQPHCPLFIFLPGMDGTGRLLRVQTAGLETAFDVRCLAIPPDDLMNWDELADTVAHLIETELQQNPQRLVYLCGESFGGCLALKVVSRSPWLISKLILVNPASSFNQRPWIRWGEPLTRLLPEEFYRVSAFGLLPFLAAVERISQIDSQALWEAMNTVPKSTSLWRLSLLSQFEITETQLQRITQPTLILAAESDRLLPSVAEAYRLARYIPNTRILTLPKSGHACLLERDVNLYQILQDHHFLEVPARSVVLSA